MVDLVKSAVEAGVSKQAGEVDGTNVKGLLDTSRNNAIPPPPFKAVLQQGLTGLHRVRFAWQATRMTRT